MELERAKIIACLLTDGSVFSVYKGKPGVIAFYNRSNALRKDFAKAIKNVFGLTIHDDGFSCKVHSINAVKELLKHSNSYRKKKFENGEFPTTTIPVEIMNGDENTIREFLKYAFSCDGSAQLSVLRPPKRNRWNFQKRVQFACSHPVLLSQFHELLLKIGINSRKETKEKRLTIDSRENLLKFVNLVGFVDGVKISGKGGSKWKGLEKNDILKIFLFLYKISDSLGAKRFEGGFWKKNFQDNNQIIEFLRQKAKELGE